MAIVLITSSVTLAGYTLDDFWIAIFIFKYLWLRTSFTGMALPANMTGIVSIFASGSKTGERCFSLRTSLAFKARASMSGFMGEPGSKQSVMHLGFVSAVFAASL